MAKAISKMTRRADRADGFVITRYDAESMRSVPVGAPFATIEAAYRRLVALEAKAARRFPLLVDLASWYGLSARDSAALREEPA